MIGILLTAVERHDAVSAQFTSKQILHFALAKQYSMIVLDELGINTLDT